MACIAAGERGARGARGGANIVAAHAHELVVRGVGSEERPASVAHAPVLHHNLGSWFRV